MLLNRPLAHNGGMQAIYADEFHPVQRDGSDSCPDTPQIVGIVRETCIESEWTLRRQRREQACFQVKNALFGKRL